MDVATVGPEEILERRPFTHPAHTEREVAVMREMLEYERGRARAWAGEQQAACGRVIRERDPDGHRRLIVVPDATAFLDAENVTAVGFFGRPRTRVDHRVLFALEDELVTRMARYGTIGLLSYYDVELVKGRYGNLILFSTHEVPRAWHEDEVHRQAVELSPYHYYEVRLHKGTVAGPLFGGGDIEIERTKYFDFKRPPARWHGVRSYPRASGAGATNPRLIPSDS